MKSGIDCLIAGFSFINKKGIKRYIYIPMLINIILFSLTFYWLYNQVSVIEAYLINWLPNFLSWLIHLLFPIMLVATLFFFSLLFTTLNNFIAAPFHGLLASKVEAMLKGNSNNSAPFDLMYEIKKALVRETQKLIYFIPRAFVYFLIFLFVPVFGQIIWFVFMAWMMALQYCDYSFDNNEVSFHQMRDELWQHKAASLPFGAGVSLLTMIPFINLIIAPVAVCGATVLWVERLDK